MRKFSIIAIFLMFLLIYGCASTSKTYDSKAGLVLSNTYIYAKFNPNDAAPSADNEMTKVNRGEAVTIKQEQKSVDQKSWYEIVLSDGETRGWIRKEYIHNGPKLPIVLTQKAVLYVRPDTQSRAIQTLQRGASMYILIEKDEWKKVSVEYKKDGWIMTKDYQSGLTLGQE